MNELQVFNFMPEQIIRANSDENGVVWFIALDICRVLDIANSSHALSRLDDDEKGVVISDTLGGQQEFRTINESGLYSLILTSRKPEAKVFKRWVTHDVIPSIRKTGSYTATPSFKVPQTLSEALRLAADLSDKVEAQALQIEHQRPAVEFVERFVEAKQTQNLRDVAKVIGIKQNDFVDLLISKGVLFRSRGKLTPKAEHMSAGRFEVKEIVTKDGFATVHMRFTTLGVEWIARKVVEWNQKAVVPA